MAKLKRVKLAKTITHHQVAPGGRNELRDIEATVSGWGIAIPTSDGEDEVVIPWAQIEYCVRKREAGK